MKTILCYAFPQPQTGSIWDLIDRLAAADLGYMHDCVAKTVYVRFEDAEKAVTALHGSSFAEGGRMATIAESDWPSIDETDAPFDPNDIDFDPREEWCAGPAPRYAL